MGYNKQNAIQQVKRIYCNNSIIQFWISYAIVLILPLVILSWGFKSAFYVMEQDINESNITMLSHSKSLIDIQLKAMESKVLQISNNSKVCNLAERKVLDGKFFQDASLVLNEYDNLMRYQEVNLVNSSYVYMKNSDYVMYGNTLYKLNNFEKYIRNDYNISLEEWKKICLNDGNSVPYYININGHLQYIKPFTTEFGGEVVGAIVLDIDQDELRKVLNINGKSDERSIFIYNEDKKLIWSAGNISYKDKLDELDWSPQGLIHDKDLFVIHSDSNVTDWNFVVVVSEKLAMDKLNRLKITAVILITLALALGIGLSLYMSIRKGKPINEMFNIYIEDNDMPRSFENLGGMVSKIVHNNQVLLEEIELEKPMLRNAFLNKLVKGDFVNEKELNLLAEKVGIEMECNTFRVVSFRLFLNNDLYDVDSQTLSEVQVLFHLIQNYILQRSKETVWFYEKDYLTTLAIFHISEEPDNIQVLVEQVHDLILKEYSVDSTWGISYICNSVLEIWRACEEAKVANNYCKSERVVVYSSDLDEKDGYYYPELFEERIIKSIRATDISNIDSLLSILHTENFRNRSISRRMMLKLNKRIILSMSSNFTLSSETEEEMVKLNSLIKNSEDFESDYFGQLKLVCHYLCGEIQKKKTCNRNKLIQNIVNYINEQYMDSNLGLSLVAAKFNISEGYVSTIFKGDMGVNFADYVESIRINCACKLLENSDETISVIAEKIGYNSVQSFRRAFKKVKGISPKELRNKPHITSL
jgi:YesN/AraC family two-component response regulator